MAAGLLFDENVPAALPAQLLRRNPDIRVRKVGDLGVPEKGTTDQDILCWCEEHDYVLVTFNRKSMPVHLAHHLSAGRHVPGVLLLPDTMTMGQLLDELLALGGQIESIDLQDSIRFLHSPE